MILTINGQQAALKKGSSIEYVSENRIFTDADDYSMEIELPLADCPRNLGIFGHPTRKDVDMGDIFFEREGILSPLRFKSILKKKWHGGKIKEGGIRCAHPSAPRRGATNSMNDTACLLFHFFVQSL